MAVVLQGHQLLDLAGAEVDDPTDVVAGEVDQHDVLGHLLRMLPQLTPEAPVLLLAAPPPASARNRPGDHPALEQLHHRLRRRTHHRHLGVAHEVHVGAGVHEPQHTVNIERFGLEVEVEALRQHDLENVAGEDVLLRDLDGPLVLA